MGLTAHTAAVPSELLSHPALWRGSGFARVTAPSLPSGFAALDAELPGGGWPAGALTEILSERPGTGEMRLLGPALARLSAAGRRLAWIAPPHHPYAPALAAAGIELSSLTIVRTANGRETLWAAEQALVSHACGAILAWPAASLGYAELRRLQLAAEGGRTFAVLFRPEKAADEPSPAALRIGLALSAGKLAVRILKRRGAPLDRPVLLPAISPASPCPEFPALATSRHAPAAAGEASTQPRPHLA